MGLQTLHPGLTRAPSLPSLADPQASQQGILTPARKEWDSGLDPSKILMVHQVGLEDALLPAPAPTCSGRGSTSTYQRFQHHFGMQFIIIMIWELQEKQKLLPSNTDSAVVGNFLRPSLFPLSGKLSHKQILSEPNPFYCLFCLFVFKHLHKMPRGQRKWAEGRVPTWELKPNYSLVSLARKDPSRPAVRAFTSPASSFSPSLPSSLQSIKV